MITISPMGFILIVTLACIVLGVACFMEWLEESLRWQR